MIRSVSRLPATLVLLVLLLAEIAGADPVTGPRIDLGVPDPPGLDELPGIDEAEITLLQEIAGPGHSDLGDRLAETGIPRERLLLWVPYLEISGMGDPDLRGKLRVECGRKPAHPLRSQLRCSFARSRIRWEALLEQTFPTLQTTVGVVREARIGIEFDPSAAVWAGSVTGGIQGGNPWDDPLRKALTSSALPRRFRLRSSRTARGVVAMIGSCGLATWKREGEGSGFLLTLAEDPHTVWYGRSSGRGDGIGGSFPLGRVRCTGTVCRPDAAPAVVSLGLQAIERPTHASISWALGERQAQPSTRFDAGASGRLGGWRIRLALALLSDDRRAHTRSRGMIRLRWGQGAMRASLGGTWDERLTRLRTECDLVIRSCYHLRIDGRSTVSPGNAPILLSLIPCREGRRTRIELGFLGRTDNDLSWPGIGVRESVGRVAVRFGVDHTSGGIRVRGVLVAPMRTAGRAVSDCVFWKFSLEQRGG